MIDRYTKPWLLLKPIYYVSNLRRMLQKHQWDGMTKLAQDSIDFFEEKYSNFVDANASKLKPQIFCDQVFKNRSEFTSEELVHEVNLMIIAVSVCLKQIK